MSKAIFYLLKGDYKLQGLRVFGVGAQGETAVFSKPDQGVKSRERVMVNWSFKL